MKQIPYGVACFRLEAIPGGEKRHHLWSGTWDAQNPIQALAKATTGDGVSLRDVGPLMQDQGEASYLELRMNGILWEVQGC